MDRSGRLLSGRAIGVPLMPYVIYIRDTRRIRADDPPKDRLPELACLTDALLNSWIACWPHASLRPSHSRRCT